MRRWFVALTGLFALWLAGCGGAAPTAEVAPSGAAPAGFPLTLPQIGGELRLEKPPERIYVVDNWGLDIVASLGVKPVGAATYFPPSPWLADKPELGGVEITTITEGLPLETIAAAQPDLIVDLTGSYAEDRATADKLTGIAPVLYPPKDWLADGWRERVRHAGAALGRSAAAETIIGQAEGTLATVRTENPQLAGAPLTFARFDPPASFALIVGDSDFTRRFLNTELGVTTPPAQTRAFGSEQFDKVGGSLEGVSLEHGDLIDAEAAAAMIWFQDDANLEALARQPAWRQIPVVAENRLVPMDINTAIAFRTPTPAAIAWAAEIVLPDLAAAVAAKADR